ncbi:MAG: glycosyltransferase family 2 protein [Candidatus Daviesbacteria bacterium]|nr:glycosyltransferase family 2 protein [Candidatus Daviesbacteria bacterium]
MTKISVVLAVFNEENNLEDCLDSVRDLTDEIVIVDGGSTDNTVEIARKFNAKIIQTDNPPIFHINKQKAIDAANTEWILQLDADERLTPVLVDEIKRVIDMSNIELQKYQINLSNKKLLLRHQEILEKRDGHIGTSKGEYTAFFIPRLNYFLGTFLKHGGVYPDGVIRLIKKGKTHFPCKSVHEQISVEGKVGWLQNDLLHYDSPTFGRYIKRNFRYIKLIVDELKRDQVGKNPVEFFNYCFIKPVEWFLLTLFRHKGILDGIPGIIFSFFSALRFPRAYIRYLLNLN